MMMLLDVVVVGCCWFRCLRSFRETENSTDALVLGAVLEAVRFL